VLTILGLWKLPCAVALLVPGFVGLKEWAYAGAFFNYSGAAASHFLAGDDAVVWLGPATFAALTLASWALRPAERRLPHVSPTRGTLATAWIVPVALIVVFLALALLTLPAGPPPPWTYGNPMTGH
jgi:DoxX-like family